MARLTAVRLRNEGNKPFSQKYAGERYVIPPKVDMIVPYDAMVLWLGDPELVDLDRRRRLRTDEYARLCVKYGVYDKPLQLGDELFPKLEAYSLADNERITTVLDDPEGVSVTPGLQAAATNARQAEQMELMTRQMEEMRQQMALLKQGVVGGAGVNLDPDDTRADAPEARPEVQVKKEPEPPVENENVGGAVPDRPNAPKNGPRKVSASA